MFFRQICLLVFSLLWVSPLHGQAETLLQEYPLESPELRSRLLTDAKDIIARCNKILALGDNELSLRDRFSVMTLAGYTYAQLGFADSARNMLKWIEREDSDQYAYPEKMMAYISEGALLIRSYESLQGYRVLHEAQQIAIANGDVYNTHYISTVKGISLYLQGVEEQAFSLMREGINELKNSGFSSEALQFENNLAALLIRSGYYDEAMDVLDHASRRSGSGVSPDFATYLWLNKALAKFKSGGHDLDVVLSEVDIGIGLAKDQHFTIGQLFGYALKGEILAEQGRWNEAQKALAYYDDPAYQAIFSSQRDLYSYSNLIYGKIQEHLKNWEEAQKAYQYAVTHTVPGSRFPDYETGFQGLHRIALATGDKEEASEVFRKLSHLKDSLFQQKNQANFELIEARRELSLKDQQITEAEQQLEIQDLSRRLLIGVMVLAVLLSFILFLVYRNRTIQREKEKTEKINRQLELYTNELEELAFVVSHNLRESARNISTFTGLFSRSSEDQLTGKSRQYLHHMQSASIRTSAMLSDLENYVGIGKNLPDPIVLSLNKVLNEMIEETKLIAIRDQINIGPLPAVIAHPSMMRLIFHQLLDNCQKFSQPDQLLEINITAEQLSDRLLIHVEDNGIGFDPRYTETIFRVFQRLQSVDDVEGTGIGLAIADKAIRYYGGEIEVSSTPGKGSRFSVCFPAKMLPLQG